MKFLLSLWQRLNIKRKWFIGGVLVACLGIATWVDMLRRADQEVDRFWGVLKIACDQRVEMFPQLGKIIQTQLPQAQALLEYLNKVYIAAKSAKVSERPYNLAAPSQQFSRLQQQVVLAFFQIQQEIAEKYPSFRQNPQYLLFQKHLQESNMSIDYTAHALRQRILRYNSLVDEFPQKWVNKIYPRYPIKYGLELSSNLER